MGKGDSRSRRGKIFKGSYGKTRVHDPAAHKKKAPPAGAAPQPRAAVKRTPAPRAGRREG